MSTTISITATKKIAALMRDGVLDRDTRYKMVNLWRVRPEARDAHTITLGEFMRVRTTLIHPSSDRSSTHASADARWTVGFISNIIELYQGDVDFDLLRELDDIVVPELPVIPVHGPHNLPEDERGEQEEPEALEEGEANSRPAKRTRKSQKGG